MKAESLRAFVSFALIGGAAAALNVGSRALIERNTSFEIAAALGFPIALTCLFGQPRDSVWLEWRAMATGNTAGFFLLTSRP
jgi:putative flippase GtrA